MKTLLTMVVALFVVVGATQSTKAQEGSFLIGLETGQVLGASGMYQISDMIQVGSGLGLQIQENSNVFYLAPQARFLIDMGVKNTNIMLDAQLRLLFGDQSQTALVIRGGLQHWVSKSFAVYGGFGILDIGFDPSYTTFGFLAPFVGAQFAL
jgi:hypothetical protein